jgi:MFS family permease
MHFTDPPPVPASSITKEPHAPAGPWWRELNRYHWFVLVVAALGWLFDTMDQQLFTLARIPAMRELVTPVARRPAASDEETRQAEAAAKAATEAKVNAYSGYSTAIFLIGWASGGVAFGILGDRIGRARTMVLTILAYSLCTGLSALSVGFWDFAFYRFLTGLGVGGEFAVGVSLVAEAMPDRARPHALGWLQALSAVGNVSAALIGMALSAGAATAGIAQVSRWLFGPEAHAPAPWRIMFVVGTFPALLALPIMRRLKEPERWRSVAVSDELNQQLGSFRELFGNPRWRHNALVGLALAFSGVVGLWGIGFFNVDLIRKVLEPAFAAEGFEGDGLRNKVNFWVSITSLVQNVGGFFGIQAYLWLTTRTNRRTAFAVSFVAAAASTALNFLVVGKVLGAYDVLWLAPLMGACQLAMFGGYAIYFPELFPTRLRSTGTSFCYNMGRFVAAVGPYMLGYLTGSVFTGYSDPATPFRLAGVTMCSVFLLGLVALPFAPETKGQPLPE